MQPRSLVSRATLSQVPAAEMEGVVTGHRLALFDAGVRPACRISDFPAPREAAPPNASRKSPTPIPMPRTSWCCRSGDAERRVRWLVSPIAAAAAAFHGFRSLPGRGSAHRWTSEPN